MRRKNKFELELYLYIKENERLPPHEKREKTKIAYYCRKLKDQGLISNLGNGVWKVQNGSNFNDLSGDTTTEKTPRNRGHAYRFKVNLPYIQDWHRRDKVFRRLKVNYKEIPQGQIIKIRRHNIYVYDDSLQITFKKGKSFLTNDADKSNAYAILEFKQTLRSFEKKIRTNVSFGKSYQFSCHHANIKNAISKWHLDRGINKFTIKGRDGKVWLLMDNSFNLEELETVHAKSSSRDMKEVVAPFMNKIREEPFFLDKMQKTMENQQKVIEKQQETLLKLTESHYITQKQLESTTMALNSIIAVMKPKKVPQEIKGSVDIYYAG